MSEPKGLDHYGQNERGKNGSSEKKEGKDLSQELQPPETSDNVSYYQTFSAPPALGQPSHPFSQQGSETHYPRGSTTINSNDTPLEYDFEALSLPSKASGSSEPSQSQNSSYSSTGWQTTSEGEGTPPRRRSYTKTSHGEVEVQGQIAVTESWRRHTRVYGGGVCLACLENERRGLGKGEFAEGEHASDVTSKT